MDCKTSQETTMHDKHESENDSYWEGILKEAKEDGTYTAAKWILYRKNLTLDLIHENLYEAFAEAICSKYDQLLMRRLPSAILERDQEAQMLCMKKVFIKLEDMIHKDIEEKLDKNPRLIRELINA